MSHWTKATIATFAMGLLTACRNDDRIQEPPPSLESTATSPVATTSDSGPRTSQPSPTKSSKKTVTPTTPTEPSDW